MNKIEQKIKNNELMSQHTHFHIGGPADYFLQANSEAEIIKGIKWAQAQHIPITVLGGGSNILVLDKGIRGLVIQTQNKEIDIKKNQVKAGAGVVFMNLVNILANKGLSGLEFGCGIYGTIGGAIRGNAGSFGQEIKDVFLKADIYKLNLGRETLKNQEMNFDYRRSIITDHQDWVVLNGVFELQPSKPEKIKAQVKEFLAKKVSAQPMNLPSSGCIFKNPKIDLEKFKELKKDFGKECKQQSFWQPDRISAGFLIDLADLKGKQIGDAQVSDIHGSFIVNRGKATAEQVLILISYIKQHIRDKYGVQLQEEIEILGEI